MEQDAATPATPITVETPAATTSVFGEELKEYIADEIIKPKKFVKLLYKTNGNTDIIFKFLAAKKALKAVIREQKLARETEETVDVLKELQLDNPNSCIKKKHWKKDKKMKKHWKKHHGHHHCY